MWSEPAVPPALEDVANTARLLQTLAHQVDSHQFEPGALAGTLRQLARDLERDVAALREGRQGGTA